MAWIALAGGLLLGMALLSAYLRRLPVTSSAIYLVLGLTISPAWLDLIEVVFIRQSVFFEHLTCIAVTVSLFVGGLKLRLPLRHQAWNAAFRLARPVMLASIARVAVLAHYGFGFDWAAAFLLESVLAPTDPVLAGLVTVNDARDRTGCATGYPVRRDSMAGRPFHLWCSRCCGWSTARLMTGPEGAADDLFHLSLVEVDARAEASHGRGRLPCSGARQAGMSPLTSKLCGVIHDHDPGVPHTLECTLARTHCG